MARFKYVDKIPDVDVYNGVGQLMYEGYEFDRPEAVAGGYRSSNKYQEIKEKVVKRFKKDKEAKK